MQVGLLCKLFEMFVFFTQNLTIKEAFKTAIQLNEELKKVEFDGARGKNFKVLRNIFFSQNFKDIT